MNTTQKFIDSIDEAFTLEARFKALDVNSDDCDSCPYFTTTHTRHDSGGYSSEDECEGLSYRDCWRVSI